MGYQVNLDSFTGPLDLLIHLIEKNEIDIYNIPIAKITEEYLSYLETKEELNLDNLSEFILMALTLLQIKTALLLPDPKPELGQAPIVQAEQLQDQLVERLIEYRKFKRAAEILGKWEDLEKNLYKKTALIQGEQFLLGEITLNNLVSHLQKLLIKKKREKKSIQLIKLEEFTVEERVEQILLLLQDSVQPLHFQQLFLEDKSKLAMITSFLALLELIKLGKVKVEQESTFAPIFIKMSKEVE